MDVNALRIATDYLKFHALPDAGADFLSLHAAESLLLCQGLPTRRDAIDPQGFAEAHRMTLQRLGHSHTGFPFDASHIQQHEWHPSDDGGDKAVLSIRLQGAAGSSECWVSWGLVHRDGCYQVLWVVLEAEKSGRSFDVSHAAAMAEMAFLVSQAAEPLRSWLDLAYRRQFRYAKPRLQTVAGQKFSCHGTGSCCQIYWEVTAPPMMQAMLDAMPWKTLGAPHLSGHRLERKDDDTVYVKKGGERCTFLDENTRCRIHSALGTPVFAACVAFPFRFAETGDGVAVSTSHHCHSASNNLGLPLEARADDLWQRINQVGLVGVPAEGYPLSQGLFVDWDTFARIEGQILQVLGDPSISMFQRLWVTVRILEAEVRGIPCRIDDYYRETVPAMRPEEQILADMFTPFWLGCLGKLRPELQVLGSAHPRSLLPSDPERVSRWLRNALIGKDLTYRYDLATAVSGLVLLYLSVLTLESALERPLGDAEWATLGSIASHGRLGELFKQAFGALETLRGETADPLTPLLFLAWLDAKVKAQESPAVISPV